MNMNNLIGTFCGPGHGSYSTVPEFSYTETLVFEERPGKPFLHYEQFTVSDDGKPMHTEVGYLRPINKDKVELVIALPTGQTEALEGYVEKQGPGMTLKLTSTAVSNTSTAKQVSATSRTLELSADGATLKTWFDMAAVSQQMQPHLASVLTRVE